MIYIPWVISIFIILFTSIALIVYGLQFGLDKSLSFFRTNIFALLFTVVIFEPIRLRLIALVTTFLNGQTRLWDWLQPIRTNVIINLYKEDDVSKIEEIQEKLRLEDSRYQPMSKATIDEFYKQNKQIKRAARLKKAMNVYGLFLFLAAVIIYGDNSKAVQAFNKANQIFWEPEFHALENQIELKKYLTETLMDKLFDVDNGKRAQREISPEKQIIFMSELQIRQLRTRDKIDFYNFPEKRTFGPQWNLEGASQGDIASTSAPWVSSR